MEIEFINMPLNLGANKLGVESAFQYLKKNSNIVDFFPKHKLLLNEEIQCPSFVNISSNENLMKNKDEIFKCNKRLADITYNSIQNGRLPIIFGGDHSLSWGSISGSAKAHSNLGCIYLDAHGDFNSATTSPSHNVHGMHMAYLMGLVNSPYVNFYYSGRKLNKENVFFIGTRSLDQGEKKLAQQNKLQIYSSEDIQTQGILNVSNILLNRIENSHIQHWHLSIDIDAIDPSLAPGTGVPEKNGLLVEDVEFFIQKVIKTNKIVSIDIVEYNPRLDIEDKTLNICNRILSAINEGL